MGQAQRLTQRDAMTHARWLANREQRTHHVYRVDPAVGTRRGMGSILAVLQRFYVRPEGEDAPDGGVLVASASFSEKRESDSTPGRDAS